MRIAQFIALLAPAMVCALLAAPAQAQRARVFVASYGSDANPCTFGSPCKTFQHAHDAVDFGGEITAIDSAGFGTVTISKSITITSPNGVEAGIQAPSAGTAVTVASGAAVVILRGLTLEGAGMASTGVAVIAGTHVEIDNCVIQEFVAHGVLFSDGATGAWLGVSNTTMADNGTGAYLFDAGSAMIADFDHVALLGNQTGIQIDAHTAPVNVAIANSASNNNAIGIDVANSVSSSLALVNTTLKSDTTAINVNGPVDLYLSHVDTIYSFISYADGVAANTFSDQTNHLNLSGPGAPTNLGNWVTK